VVQRQQHEQIDVRRAGGGELRSGGEHLAVMSRATEIDQCQHVRQKVDRAAFGHHLRIPPVGTETVDGDLQLPPEVVEGQFVARGFTVYRFQPFVRLRLVHELPMRGDEILAQRGLAGSMCAGDGDPHSWQSSMPPPRLSRFRRQPLHRCRRLTGEGSANEMNGCQKGRGRAFGDS
jgi:hypothetical protein